MIKNFNKLLVRLRNLVSLSNEIQDLKLLEGKILTALLSQKNIRSLNDVEFKVFSQFGDDGIIQYLVNQIDIPQKQRVFVEFGVEDYSESNTRFLLLNNNWKGLIIDGSEKNMERAKKSNYFWKHDLTATAAFIDRDNINTLIKNAGISGEIGLLSVDIDGNDYWVWEKIDVVDPWIVVAEYNSVFGKDHPITVPYDPVFQRNKAHYSNLFWGSSLKALVILAERKGYSFVGCNSAGNNAYFIRKDKMGSLRKLTAEEGFISSRFRESRDQSGKLTYLTGDARLKEIADMEVHDIEKGKRVRISELN